jgi:hypothetical protein
LKRVPLTVLVLVLATSGSALAAGLVAEGSSDPQAGARTCGTPRPAPQDLARIQRLRRRLNDEQPLQKLQAKGGTIRVAFHVLTAGKLGQVSDAQIAAQIDELNRSYAGTDYSFRLVSVDRTDQGGWSRMNPLTGTERKAKAALAVDPAHTLNVYTAALGNKLLGWSYLPWWLPEDNSLHGVVVHYGSLPGGYLNAYNLGRTVVHEVGHYLGLLHTFENGCEAPGDLVDDTPFEAGPAFGCPEGRNTCPDPEPDPIHNYMDYSDDPCLTEFTPDQADLMHDMVTAYRPSLFVTAVARGGGGVEIADDATDPRDLTHGIEFRGAGPNPFRQATAVRFSLPHSERVRLEVFNVAGQRVRSLIDAQMPAGSHSAMFAADGLPPGLYFLQLKVGKADMSRSVILLK